MAGILERLGLTTQRFDVLAEPVAVATPWRPPASLASVLPLAQVEALGQYYENAPMQRAEAMTIPAVAKARNLLVSTITGMPLVALKPETDERVDPQPTFLQRTNLGVSPQDRMAWTVDDLIFYGYSLWVAERGAAGQIKSAAWYPIDRWKFEKGHVWVDGIPISSEQVILFNAPFEGLLVNGSRTLRGGVDIEKAWVARAKNPIPLIELSLEDDSNVGQDELEDWVDYWAAIHTSGKSAVGATPKGVTLIDHGKTEPKLFVESRNALRTDVGSFLNIRTSMLDGTIGVDSLTYSTKDGDRNLFYDVDLPFWTTPIESRLSQDDIVPSGQRVRFDRSSVVLPPAATGTATED